MRIRDNFKEQNVKDRACELLVELGFEGFSMNKLAKVCNISVGTLYIYYKDKEDLFRQLGVEISQDYYDSMLKGFSLDMSFREGLWKQWENRAAYTLENSNKVAFHHAIQSSKYREYVITESQRALTDLFKQFVQNCIDRKEIKPVSNEVFWSVAYGPLYTLIRFHLRGKSYGDQGYQIDEEAIKAAFELVVAALSKK